MASRLTSEWHYPSVYEEWQLYQANRSDLAGPIRRGEVQLASNSHNVVAYEVRPKAAAIVCRAIIGLDSTPIDEQAVLEYLKEEGVKFSCPILIKDESVQK